MGGEVPHQAALSALSALDAALAANDAPAVKSCFFPGQALWRDILALTYHIRTFATGSVVAAALLETTRLRRVTGLSLSGTAKFIPATPVLVSFSSGVYGVRCLSIVTDDASANLAMG